MFEVNDRIELINDPAIKGIIDGILSRDKSVRMYRITYTSGMHGTGLRNEDELRLVTSTDDPWSNLVSSRFYSFDDFVLNTIYHKIQNTVDNTISSLKASKTLFKPHQFIPLIKLLKYQQMRLLIADEVGLGKTIEAGHILLELFARSMINRVLVICTKTLIPKWEAEMREKFAFPFEEVDANKLIKDFSRQDLPQEYFGLINYDKFSANKKLQKFCKEGLLKFDLLICDEVQAIRNRETNRYKALKNVIEDSRAVIFLSATPINNKIDDLFNLLQLLDPVRYFDTNNFINDNELNKPFIRALNQIQWNNEPLSDIASGLRNARVRRVNRYGDLESRQDNSISELFRDDPLFLRVIDKMESGDETLENRVLIQRDLTQMNSINNLFTRTKKRDVEGISAIRQPHKCLVRYTKEEMSVFEKELENLFYEYGRGDQAGMGNRAAILPIMTRSRQMASSLPAYLSKRRISANSTDSKYDELKVIINEVVTRHKRKLILFAEFKDTLKYLRDRLVDDGYTCALITGENPAERSYLLNQFRIDPELNILLASRVGTEGIDLQFCDAMVNYDLPWNPMILEQRIGRIDRIGQESEIVSIYNMVVKGTIEEDVYDRLLSKIRIFEESIGILEAILSSDNEGGSDVIEDLEYEIYTRKLNKRQRQVKLDQVAASYINQRENINAIQTELTDAMVQDHYFRDEINKIIKNERYVTSRNLVQFIEGLVRHDFREINIVSDADKEMVLEINRDAARRLDAYITDCIRKAPLSNRVQLQLLYGEFKRLLINGGEIRLCFDSETAFKNPAVHYVSPYHPLVFAASVLFKEKQISLYNSFSFRITTKDLPGINLNPGIYILAVSELEVKKKWLGSDRVQKFLIPFGADLNGDEIRMMPESESEELYRACQSMVRESGVAENLPEEAIEQIRYEAALAVDAKRKEVEEEELIKTKSATLRYKQQFDNYYEWQIEVRRKKLLHGDGISTILRADIKNLEMEYENKIAQLDQSSVGVSMRELLVCSVEVI